jgi:isochorismate synthase EntC
LFVVSIRRLQWEGNRLCIPAGCGIIELSDFEKEFSEIERKMNSVKKVFESKPSLREIMIHE